MPRLTEGTALTSLLNVTYTVDRFLDSGTQAAVYLVTSRGKKYALKWYSKNNDSLTEHFRKLIQNGTPKDQNKQPDKRFVWPQDLIVTDSGFGYTMDFIEMSKYTKLNKLNDRQYMKGENCVKGSVLCDICINIAEALSSLHSGGYCYKDISSNNIVFNLDTGEVLIFDVDNIVVDGNVGEILGTPKYMAPEVIMGKIHPDSQSGRFSLASYFFNLFVGHLPFDGKLRDDYIKTNKVFDDNGFKAVYGKNPVFCFHPGDTSNNLRNNDDYAKVVERWENIIPLKLKEKFNKVFVKGLPFDMRSERTTNGEWVALFKEFKGSIVTCSCGRDYLPGAMKCTACQKSLTKSSVKISVKEKGTMSEREVVLKSGSIIKGETISSIIAAHPRLAEVLVNPKTGELGLKNLSALEWYYKDVNDANSISVPPATVVTLKSKRVIAFVRSEVQVTVEEAFNTLSPPHVPTVTQQQASPQIKQRTQSVAPAINSIYPFAGRNWRVLDVQNNKALIISEEIIEERVYHPTYEGTTWEKCELRSYLNGAFFNSLGQEKSRIAEERIDNPNNPWYGTSGGNATYDKVFLLSLDEVCRYFGDSGDLKSRKGWNLKNDQLVLKNGKGCFINDQYNGARIAKDSNGIAFWWWLRSSGDSLNYAAIVANDGYVYVSGDNDVGWSGGVRPALWLNLPSEIF